MARRDQANVFAASKLIGMKVKNEAGEHVGEIRDLAIEPDVGVVGYAVLSFGGVLGVGKKLFAVPWSSLRYAPDGNGFVMHVHKERLKNAPGFDAESWPALGDRAWGESIHAYYEEEPYWGSRR